jgi:enoyl-CoA hydratase/carnithine racemase
MFRSRAMEMILTGKKVSAQEMMDWGVVNHIYKKEELRSKSEAFAREFSVKSGQSLILAKSAVKFGYENSSEAGRMFERRVFDSLWSGLPGVQEGIDAFKNKRKPNFEGI